MKNVVFLTLVLTIAFLVGSGLCHDGVPEATSGFRQPMDNYTYSGYHYNEWSDISNCYHPGADYNGSGTSGDGDLGWDVLAVAKGLVVHIVDDGAFGLCVTIEHRYQGVTVYSQYAHLQSVLVSPDQTVQKGQHIAELGCSGSSCAGAHLHWEIREADHLQPHNAAYWYTVGFQSQSNISNWYEDPQEWCNNHPANSDIEQKFADVFQRNGGSSTVGNPAAEGIVSYGPYLRQNFSGGSFRDLDSNQDTGLQRPMSYH